MSIAHRFKDKVRTDDVLISESVDFSGLLLSKHVLQGLTEAGFKRPSPIQLKAIPLGRCGLDLIVQAKSGTGKTCVFTVVALESLELESICVQVLVLAPTREIAIQIHDVIQTVGKAMRGLRCHTFIGGLPLLVDKNVVKNCHIAVGTPGRVKQLIDIGALKTSSIRLFVLDEADKLLEGEFQEAINWIYSALPDNKQILALSATYTELMAQHLTAYMRNPTFVRLNVTDPALLGIKQYHVVVPNHPMPNIVFSSKTDIILKILSSVSFQQCLIFSNLQTRAQNLQSELQSRNWPTACIAGYLDQKERNLAMEQLKTYKCRILISTDLTSRGIDADKVNLVINLDVPPDHETYLHRIGRAGRFGSFGAAVTIVTKDGQDTELWAVERKCGTYIHKLPDPIPNDLVTRALPVRINDIVSVEQIQNQPVSDMIPGAVQRDNTCSQNQETQSLSVTLVSKQQHSSPQADSLVVPELRNVNRTEPTEGEKVDVLRPAGMSVLDSETPLAGAITNQLRDLSLDQAGVVLEDLNGVVGDHKQELSTENTDSCWPETSTENHNAGTLKNAVTHNSCDSKTNTQCEHLETSVVEITNTTVNLCNGLDLSKFNEHTSDSNRHYEPRLPEEQYLNTLSHVCADSDRAENLMENVDKSPKVQFQERKENTGTPDDGQNNFTDKNSCSESKDSSDSMCRDCVTVLLSKHCGKDMQGLLQTSASLQCSSDRCCGRPSSDVSVPHCLEPVVSYIHSISNEILSDALLESHLLTVQADSVSSSLTFDEHGAQVASESSKILFCDGGCKELSLGAASNPQCNNSDETSLQKVESLLIGTDPEKVPTGNKYLKNVNLSAFVGAGTDDESKSFREISHATDDKLTCKNAGHRTAQSTRNSRRHVRSFALTDFVHRMNEDLSLLTSKKIDCSFGGEDKSSGRTNVAVSAGLNAATLNVDLNCSEDTIASHADFIVDKSVSKQLDVKAGGDSLVASCCLSMETMHLGCDNSSDFHRGKETIHFQLKSVCAGDCLSHDVVSKESHLSSSNCDLSCHGSGTSGTNKTEEMLNVEVACPLVCSGERHNSEVPDATIITVNQSIIKTSLETVNRSTINEAHDPVVDLSPSHMDKDLNKPMKTLATYFSLLPLQHQNPDEHFSCADLEKDCANFCKDFDKTQLTSLERMDNFTVDDFVDSKDLQELCAFETTKLVALKSQFRSKLSEVKRQKHETEERHKSGVLRKPQVKSNSSDILQGERVGEKPLLPDDSAVHKIRGQKGRGRKSKDSLNWRNDTVEQTPGIRDEYTEHNSWLRNETPGALQHQGKKIFSEREDQKPHSVKNIHTKLSSQNAIEARTAPSSQQQTGKQQQNCHLLDGALGNSSENRRNAGKLNRPSNPQVGHVKANVDAAKDADRTGQKHCTSSDRKDDRTGQTHCTPSDRKDDRTGQKHCTPSDRKDDRTGQKHCTPSDRKDDRTRQKYCTPSDKRDADGTGHCAPSDRKDDRPGQKHCTPSDRKDDRPGQKHCTPSNRKDDECKELDDMHAQMLLRRKERKLRQAAISSDNKLLVPDARNMTPVTELTADHEAGPKPILNNETEMNKTTGKETPPMLVDPVPVKQETHTTPETEYSLVEEAKSVPCANEENDRFTSQGETPGSSIVLRSEQLKNPVGLSEGDVKSTSVMDQQGKHKAAVKEKPVQSELVLISPAAPKRLAKPSKSEARLAGLEISSGSTSSTSDLSLSSPSDISDVNLSDLDSKDIILASQCYANKYAHEVCGDLKDKNSKRKNRVTIALINSENKHDQGLPQTAAADYCDHSGVSSKRLHSLCPPAHKDDQQDYFITSCGARFRGEHTNVEHGQQFHLSTDSQAQHHVREKSGKHRTQARGGSQTQARGGSQTQARGGSQTQARGGSQTQARGGSQTQARGGSQTQARGGSHCGKHPSTNSELVYETRKQTVCSKIESDWSTESDSESGTESGGECSSVSGAESLSNIDRSHFHRSQHESGMYSPNHIQPHLYPYPSASLPCPSPYYSIPNSAWQYGYPTPQHFGVFPAPFIMPHAQVQPFYHLSQYHYQQYVSHYQTLIPQIQWEYIRHMTKMMSRLARKYSRARTSP